MKKILTVILSAVLITGVLCSCGGSASSDKGSDKSIVIGASTTPHAEILRVAAEIMKEGGYTVTIKEFDDYVMPNTALESGELEANYFQHKPYLDDFNAEKGTNLVSAGAIHYEPLGIYAGKTASLDEIKDGAQIAVPNDTTNEARALKLLEAQGLISVNPDAGFKATVKDITNNPKNLKIVEIEAAQLGRSIQDVDFAVINGNYAIKAGLDIAKDALAIEAKDSDSATTYANIVAVRNGDENSSDIQALMKALKSDKVKKFIEEKYNGAVVAIF